MPTKEMKTLFCKFTAVIFFICYLSPKSTAGPNECKFNYTATVYYSTRYVYSYYESCGIWRWGRCLRYSSYYRSRLYYLTKVRTDCCGGWRKNGTRLCMTPICSGCQNGGTCYLPDTCRCKSDNEYYGERNNCTLRCPYISNCLVEQCTNTMDVTCQLCKTNISSTVVAYEKSRNSKRCLSRCSWLNNWCWPGYCTGSNYAADRCTCATGFTGSPTCLTIADYPSVHFLNVSLEDSVNKRFANYTYSSQATVFSNFVPDKVVVALEAQFFGPLPRAGTFNTKRWGTDYRSYKAPPWISKYDLGITRTNMVLSVSQAGTGMSRLLRQSELECRHLGRRVSLSNSAPSSTVDCTLTYDLMGQTFNHGDELNVDIEVRNGGFIVIKDMEKKSTTTHYYSGTPKIVTAQFVFDRVPPVHCSVDNSIKCPTCITASSMLSVGDSQVRKERLLTVTWDGWFDTAGGSGVSKYSFGVYEMIHTGQALSENAVPFYRHSFNITVHTHSLVLSQPGLFSVVLHVYDAAGNYRIARRIVLYDDSSVVTVDLHHPLSFPRAIKSGNIAWKTVANGQVLANLTGHFYNTLINKGSLLQSISSFRQTIDSGYDQQATGTLGLRGTLNYAGIVSYRYAISYGLNPQQAIDSDFQYVPKTSTELRQYYTMFTSTSDGDHITVWVKAIDIWGNTDTDNATVHVDFSPPGISQLGLTRNGETLLAFLNSQELHTMQVSFDVSDPHSGVATAFWKLGKTRGGSQMGQGQILTRAKSQSDCHRSNCSCNSLIICSYFSYDLDLHPGQFSRGYGQHARKYYLTIIATNDAQLSSSKHLTVTVDSSPPLSGQVIDGIVGQMDIDSQQSNTIRAYWLGFQDPESGIRYYKYSVASSCLTKANFTSDKSTIYKTSSQSCDFITATGPGTYYVSVIAYNNALESSAVACSDGVAVDNTPPTIEKISVSHLRSTPGIIKEAKGNEVWIIDDNRLRQRLTGLESVCSAHALIVKDISIYPLSTTNVSLPTTATLCPYGPSSLYFYTQINQYVFVSWEGSDKESGIQDYEVGLGRNQYEDPPTVLNFRSTHGIPHYFQLMSRLPEGLEYFVIIEAINKAGIKAKKAVGPIIVDMTAPRFTGKLEVSRYIQKKAILISWTSSTFVDPEDSSL